jgi:predicted nucleic acid-binding protein
MAAPQSETETPSATKVIVDAVIWSKVYRWKHLDKASQNLVDEMSVLIAGDWNVMLGAVRQEVLSGISERATFEAVKQKLSRFPDYLPQSEDYVLAAEFSNTCRTHGVQGSPTDFLICAVAARNSWEIFTEDNDFLSYRRHLPITLYQMTPPIPAAGNNGRNEVASS